MFSSYALITLFFGGVFGVPGGHRAILGPTILWGVTEGERNGHNQHSRAEQRLTSVALYPKFKAEIAYGEARRRIFGRPSAAFLGRPDLGCHDQHFGGISRWLSDHGAANAALNHVRSFSSICLWSLDASRR